MKLYDSLGPNPRMVRMFLIEKGLELESVEFDLLGGENRREPFTNRNPAGQLPALELDDGTVIAETTVMCDYLEEFNPEPALIGADAAQRAETRMWTRRIEQRITEPAYNGFRFAEGLGLFQNRMRCLPEAADGLKAISQDGLIWLDKQMEGKEWICGDRFTVADMVLYCCVDFVGAVGQSLPEELGLLHAWRERVAARPSASSSLHAQSAAAGMPG